jgi:HrpA-like RNA helicase
MTTNSIDIFSEHIIGIMKICKIFIITGETGSGKTTKLPAYIYFSILANKPNENIVCSQPRRLAVKAVSKYISKKLKVKLGTKIGYSVRFEKCYSKNTKVKFITEGLLLKEFSNDSSLTSYSIIIIDEAHERSTNIDLLLSFFKKLIKTRSDIKIIICSATLEIQKFSKFFSNCPIFSIPGRSFSVKVFFTKKIKKNFISACFLYIINIIKGFKNGDLLVFLPGKEDIDLLGHLLFSSNFKKKNQTILEIIPIYGGLPLTVQLNLIKKSLNVTKVYLSTNIAETSLTLPNISFVIDSGFSKKKVFNPKLKSEKLILSPISKLCAAQRKGRTGRTQIGFCYRIYTKWSYKFEIKKTIVPEIQRIELTAIILFLKNLEVNNLILFEWIDPPTKSLILQSLKILYSLGTLDKKCKISSFGRKISFFPVMPSLGRSIIFSKNYNCIDEILSVTSLFLTQIKIPKRFCEKILFEKTHLFYGDHIIFSMLFKIWEKNNFSFFWCKNFGIDFNFMILGRNIKSQLKNILKSILLIKKSKKEKKQLNRAIFIGFFLNIAVFSRKNIFIPIFCKKKLILILYPSNLLFNRILLPLFICFFEIISFTKNQIKLVMPIKKINIKRYFKLIK